MDRQLVTEFAKQAGFEIIDFEGDNSCVIVADREGPDCLNKFAELVARHIDHEHGKDKLLRGKLTELITELKSDYDRPEGRWGIHGSEVVDDDYFEALDYVIKKLDALLSGEEMPN